MCWRVGASSPSSRPPGHPHPPFPCTHIPPPCDAINQSTPWLQIAADSVLTVSSTSGLHLDTLTEFLARTALAMPHVNDSVPQSYMQLSTSLSTLSTTLLASPAPPIITRAQLQAHVRAAGLELPQDRLGRALEFLVTGGAVVASADRDVVILDPAWLADTLAAAISASPARLGNLPPDLACRGFLSHRPESLGRVWGGQPPAIWGLLVQMLHRFDLAFELTDADGRPLGVSLVPSMLPQGVRGCGLGSGMCACLCWGVGSCVHVHRCVCGGGG
jgi:hypothetical protein